MPQISWSLEKSIWDAVDDIVKLGKWKKVSFHYSSREFLPKSRGIYLVSVSSKTLSSKEPFSLFMTPVYVGHATNLQKRFTDHTNGNREGNLRYNLSSLLINVTFYFLEMDGLSKDSLKYHEQTLIDLFGGSLNSINSINRKKMDILKKINGSISVIES